MEQALVTPPGAVALDPPSTILNPDTVNLEVGGGRPNLTETKEHEKSIEDVLSEESKRLRDDSAEKDKPKADPKKEAKPEEKARSEDGKFARPEKAEEPAKAEQGAVEKPPAERGGQNDRPSEGRKHAEPPARFLPEARTKWANVPNEVKAEVHRVSQEYEAEITKAKAATERYEPIRQFDEIARSNGRELKDSLAKVVQVEQALARDPIAGLDMILREIGPRKADGSAITLMDVAQHVMSQGYQSPIQTQPQADPQVRALEQRIQSFEAQMAAASVQPVIDAFAASHPDYAALEPQIGAVLVSGVIEQIYGPGLSPEQKLAEAYRMAGGQPSHPSQQAAPPPPVQERPVNPDAGKKSVRGAPADGADPRVDEPETEITELIRKEMRKLVA